MGHGTNHKLLVFDVVDERSEVAVLDSPNRPYSFSQHWTGTSLQRRLMRGNILKLFAFEKLFPHKPPLEASSSPLLRIRILSIKKHHFKNKLFFAFQIFLQFF